MAVFSGFIIDTTWNEQLRQIELFVKSKHESFHLIFNQERPLFFVASESNIPNHLKVSEKKNLPLKSFDQKPVTCLYFNCIQDLNNAKK